MKARTQQPLKPHVSLEPEAMLEKQKMEAAHKAGMQRKSVNLKADSVRMCTHAK